MQALRRLFRRNSPSPSPPAPPLPPPISFILANKADFPSIYPARSRPDSPLATLYRISIAIVAARTLTYRAEIEYFFNRHHPSWLVSAIPAPPADCPQQQLALLAGITYILCRAFNRLISTGLPRNAPQIIADDEWEALRAQPRVLESPPQWAVDVVALAGADVLVIPDAAGDVPSVSAEVGAAGEAEAEAEADADMDMLRKGVLVNRLAVEFV